MAPKRETKNAKAPKKETKAPAKGAKAKKEEPKKEEAPVVEFKTNYISHARVKTALTDHGINAAIEAEVAKVKEPLDEYKRAKQHLESGKIEDVKEVKQTVDGEEVTVKEKYERNITADEKKAFNATVKKHEKHVASYENDLAAYKKCSIRMGSHTNDAIASIADSLMLEICERSLRHTFEVRGKKNVNEKYLYESDLSQMTLFPLIQTLPLYVSSQAAFNAQQKAESDDKMIKEAIKAYLKEHNLHVKKHAKKEEAEEVPAAEAEPVADEKKSYPFACYIKQLGKDVVAIKFPGEQLRIHKSVYQHLSDMLEQFIARLVKQLVISVRDAKNKTVNVDMVMSIIKRFLVDGRDVVEAVTIENAKVVDPKALEAEEAKKEEAKKAGKKYKIDESKLPMVTGRVATHTVEYPGTGYDECAQRVNAFIASFKK